MLSYRVNNLICFYFVVSLFLAGAEPTAPNDKTSDSSNETKAAETVSPNDSKSAETITSNEPNEAKQASKMTPEEIKAANEEWRIHMLLLLFDEPPGGIIDLYPQFRRPAKEYFDDAKTAELAEAAENGDIERVNALVASGANPNARGLAGFTPLIYSMTGKTSKGFQRLLELGGDPNLKTDRRLTNTEISAMRIAVLWPIEYLKLALAHGGNPNLIEINNSLVDASTTRTAPIFHASGDPERIQLLVKDGADVNIRDEKGWTPLMFAAYFGAYDGMYALLEAGADFRAKDDKSFLVSCYIHINNPDVNKEARKKCMEFMEKRGVDFKKVREQYKIEEFPKELTAAEAAKAAEAKKERYIRALHEEIFTAGKTRTRKYPAKEYFDDAKTAELAEAAINGDTQRVNALVAAGANPNAKGLFGFTPLMYSMAGKTLSGFQRLLELGGDPNLQSQSGYSAMSFAASRQESASLKLVLAHGGNLNLASRPSSPIIASRPTPIFETTTGWNTENARILIKAGADLNARDSYGKTPLMDAATFSFDVMYVLLEAGADIRAKDDAGLPVSYYVLYHDDDYNPLLDSCQSQKKCREFMEKKGVDFKKEKIQNEEILRQYRKKQELEGEKGRQSQEGKNTK
jgi:uncharacterized protein